MQLRCCDPRGAMSCGSPIPRGERIAKPAEWDSHLAGSAFWGSGHCSCGLDRSTRDLDRSDRQPECPGATRSPAPRQRSCSPAACSPSAANPRHPNRPPVPDRRSVRAQRWRPRSPSSGPEPWPRAAPLATKPPQPSLTRSPAPCSPSVTTSTRVGRSRTTRAVTTRAGGGTTRARAPRSATTSPTAADYFTYFGAAAGDPTKGYYSYDFGAWHIVALNSVASTSAGSPQEQWLRADLAADPQHCTLAYWHYPRFSSGSTHGSMPQTQPLWQALYDAGADIVLSGHEHNYERFAPQTPGGALDQIRGIREFVVGTGGGAGAYAFGTPIANSEVRITGVNGVLRLTLGDVTYTWQFIPVAGKTATDAGSGTCHNSTAPLPPPPPPPPQPAPPPPPRDRGFPFSDP